MLSIFGIYDLISPPVPGSIYSWTLMTMKQGRASWVFCALSVVHVLTSAYEQSSTRGKEISLARKMDATFRNLICFLATFGWSVAAFGHDASLTLKQSNPNHVELIFSLEPVQILHAVLAAQLDIFSFLKLYSEKPLAEFDADLSTAAGAVEHAITLESADGTFLVISEWHWPSAVDWQNDLRQQVDQLLNGPAKTAAIIPIEVTARAASETPLSRIRLRIDPPLRPIFLIRPDVEQFWIDEMAPDAILDF
jgi:hypothetical protein